MEFCEFELLSQLSIVFTALRHNTGQNQVKSGPRPDLRHNTSQNQVKSGVLSDSYIGDAGGTVSVGAGEGENFVQFFA